MGSQIRNLSIFATSLSLLKFQTRGFNLLRIFASFSSFVDFVGQNNSKCKVLFWNYYTWGGAKRVHFLKY